MDNTEQQPRTGILDAALRGMQSRPHDPITRFVNKRTGGVILTRDIGVYRRVLEWSEQPFDLTSPVPRRTQWP